MADLPASSQVAPGAGTASSSNKRLYIKAMTISKFRSYSEAKVSNFSARHNCIVGPNGSGKSNFFAALEFVLGEREFANLSAEERQQMLHEGNQDEPVFMASVEVTFDNSEGRLPIDAEEVKLQRTVGLKKDEFFVNNKHIAKQEVENLLESAGFSKSNPYYICRQGKVAELCTMSDAQRLNLLKEVAGTTVYDGRRRDSEKLLEEAEKKSAQIDESIANITSRLNELKHEKEELEQFRELDRERRGLDYLLSTGELQESEKKIDALEQDRLKLVAEVQDCVARVETVHEEIENSDSALNFAQAELARLESERKTSRDNFVKASTERTKRELDVRDQEERLKVRSQKLAESKAAIVQVENEIEAAEEQLERREGAESNKDGLRFQLERSRKALEQCRDTIKRLEQRENEIRSKQGRTARFGNDVKKRNEWIDEEIRNVQVAIDAKNKAFEAYENQKQKMQKEKVDYEAKLKTCETELGEIEAGREQAQLGRQKAREATQAAQARRKELWRSSEEHEEALRKASEDLKKAQRTMSEIVPVAFDSGLRALDDICQTRGIDKSKVHGPLYSLLRCENPNYRTAVEVAAGNQLLHVVVDSDATAAELMKGLLEKRAGRLTFKPLNVLSQRERQLTHSRGKAGAAKDDDDDDDEGPSGGDVQELINKLANDSEVQKDDAIPLITKITYDDKFGPAVRAMLGRTLLCRNHRVASFCAQKYKVDCVTLDGDQVSRRGALSGGFVDTKRSRLTAYEDVLEVSRKVEKHERFREDAKAKVQKEDQEVAKLAGEFERIESTLKRLESTSKTLKEEKTTLSKSLRALEERYAELDRNSASFAKPADLIEKVRELEKEKSQPPLAALKEDERAELLSIPAQLEDLRSREKELAAKEGALNAKVVALKSDLEDNLRRRREELLAIISSGGAAGAAAGVSSSQEEGAGGALESAAQALENAKSDLETSKREEMDAKTALETVEQKFDRTAKEASELSSKLNSLRAAELKATEDREKAESKLEKILDSRDVFLRDRDKATRKIRELGMLQSAELEKLKHLSAKQLATKLQKVNTELKKFSGVNKKALDQFVTFSEQKQALVQRQKEGKDADAKIRALIEHLDRQKDEAILLTFKQVSRNFREIFSELIPDGLAELRMIKGRDEDENVEPDARGVNAFAGVSPRVSFSGSKDTVPMKQLSGGQKALVALTLIFAIQRCDPAPFYLFDEIDQALDSNHRTAVAALIQRQARSSKGAQFITTTFRPELVEVADKCFGIQFANKVSSVGLIDKDQALKFIKLARVDNRAARKAAAADEPSDDDAERGDDQEEEEGEELDEKKEAKKVTPKKRVSPEQKASSVRSSAQSSKKRRASQRQTREEEDD